MWHHTSRAGFEGILTSASVWATDLAHMNDPQEIVHGLAVLSEAWQQFAEEENLPHATRSCMDDLILVEKLRSYFGHLHVFSTTIKDDDLYQWQAYSKADGFSVGLDVQQPLIANLKQNQLVYNSMVIGVGWFKVVYEPKLQNLVARLFIQDLVASITRAQALAPTQPLHNHDLIYFKIQVLAFVASLKDQAWATEREVRNFILFSNAKPLFRESAAGHVPYIQLSGIDTSRPGHHFDRLPIVTVRHGYSATAEDVAWARTLLDTHGYSHVQLLRSSVPLR